MGFVLSSKPLEKKRTVNLHYLAGFERVARKTVQNFRKDGAAPDHLPQQRERTDDDGRRPVRIHGAVRIRSTTMTTGGCRADAGCQVCGAQGGSYKNDL